MKVLHLSDTHYLRDYKDRVRGSSSAYDQMLAGMSDVLPGLRRCLLADYAQDCDLVVISGDLTDGGAKEDYQTLREAFDAYRAESGCPHVPVLITPGNHDHTELLIEDWLGQNDNATMTFGRDGVSWNVFREEDSDEPVLFGVVVVDGCAFVSFDSARFGHPNGLINERRVHTLKDLLASLGSLPKVLVTHHHLDPEQFSTPAADAPHDFWDMLKDFNVQSILNGHTHHFARGEVCGIPYRTAMALSFQGENRKDGSVWFWQARGCCTHKMEAGSFVDSELHTFMGGEALGAVRF